MRNKSSSVMKALLTLAAIFTLASEVAISTHGQTRRRPRPAVSRPSFYTVRAGETLRVRINETLSSKSARIGDRFTTTVVDPVYAGGAEVIPAGSKIGGRVTAVNSADRKGETGSIDVVFDSLQLPNGTNRAINGSLTSLDAGSTSSDNEGQASGKRMKHRKVKFIGGGAAGGALIGAIAGGGKGAAIGGAIGAGAGILGDMLTKGKEAEVKSGTEFGVILNRAVSLPAFRS